jgi:hypothetical protein
MHSTIEGCIRQSTENPRPTFNLTLLTEKRPVNGISVVKRGDSVKILTESGEIPIYSFKMTSDLMALLKCNMEEWYE